jgi:hypothetical protein
LVQSNHPKLIKNQISVSFGRIWSHLVSRNPYQTRTLVKNLGNEKVSIRYSFPHRLSHPVNFGGFWWPAVAYGGLWWPALRSTAVGACCPKLGTRNSPMAKMTFSQIFIFGGIWWHLVALGGLHCVARPSRRRVPAPSQCVLPQTRNPELAKGKDDIFENFHFMSRHVTKCHDLSRLTRRSTATATPRNARLG